MHWVLKDSPKGGKEKKFLPFIPSLLFVRSLKQNLDEVVGKIDTLQYQFVKGAPQNTPMIVPMDDMERFKKAVELSESCTYFAPEEITPEMYGKRVRIMGGALDGSIGHLLKMRGSKKKRLLLQLKGLLVASVEIESGYIQLL